MPTWIEIYSCELALSIYIYIVRWCKLRFALERARRDEAKFGDESRVFDWVTLFHCACLLIDFVTMRRRNKPLDIIISINHVPILIAFLISISYHFTMVLKC